ncbi:MAG: hypothetical protein PHW32_01355 [Bacilli bacterium]|nr:hypothetical protein [Bacilli bacterium]MDD4282343.1 hypothetical protein [Bacilli bacterium]MDD4718459.1 hypothetical protein [Bacilli bacterium]
MEIKENQNNILEVNDGVTLVYDNNTNAEKTEEVIKRCEEWIELFKEVHDIFKELTLKDKYRKQNITMNLNFKQFFSLFEPKIKGRTISLDLVQLHTTILEGVNINIEDKNIAVYDYLMANVLDYYILQNYKDTEIDINSPDFSWVLYSNEKNEKFSVKPIVANLGSFPEYEKYKKLIINIVTCHNLGMPTDQLLNNLRNNINNQELSEISYEDFSDSSKQHKLIKDKYNKK